MAIILRSDKGAPLTHPELDGNFSSLDSDIGQTLIDANAYVDSALSDIDVMGATGGSTTSDTSPYTLNPIKDQVFYINENNVRYDFVLDSATNVMSAGPITVDDTVTVTIPINSTWVVV
jgi:hypothetical protein